MTKHKTQKCCKCGAPLRTRQKNRKFFYCPKCKPKYLYIEYSQKRGREYYHKHKEEISKKRKELYAKKNAKNEKN